MDAAFTLGTVGHFGLAVVDPRASADWYVANLFMREAFSGDDLVAVESPGVTIVLRRGEPSPETLGHVAFALRDMPMLRRAYGWFRSHGIPVEDNENAIGPEAPGSPNLGLWLRDPDGYRIELNVRDGALADAAERAATA